MIARPIALLALVVAAYSLCGCSGARNRRQSLQDAVTSYSTAVRWGHIQKASRYVPDKERGAFIARKRAAYQRLRVHEVEVRSVHLNGSQEKARVLLAMSFSVSGNPVIQHHIIEQLWRHSPRGWVVVKRGRVKRVKERATKPGDLY